MLRLDLSQLPRLLLLVRMFMHPECVVPWAAKIYLDMCIPLSRGFTGWHRDLVYLTSGNWIARWSRETCGALFQCRLELAAAEGHQALLTSQASEGRSMTISCKDVCKVLSIKFSLHFHNHGIPTRATWRSTGSGADVKWRKSTRAAVESVASTSVRPSKNYLGTRKTPSDDITSVHQGSESKILLGPGDETCPPGTLTGLKLREERAKHRQQSFCKLDFFSSSGT
jgi:hypothetical protein